MILPPTNTRNLEKLVIAKCAAFVREMVNIWLMPAALDRRSHCYKVIDSPKLTVRVKQLTASKTLRHAINGERLGRVGNDQPQAGTEPWA
jgi:hypothetical protein